jgi:hypothetical protein
MRHLAHVWVAFRAVEKLAQLDGLFANRDRNRHLRNLLDFLPNHFDLFVQGLWHAHSILKEDLEGGHRWCCRLDDRKGSIEHRLPPVQNLCQLKLQRTDWRAKIAIDPASYDFPSRCEGLSLALRDAAIFRNRLDRGDPTTLNDCQLTMIMLLLAHYTTDAHMPLRCDDRLVGSAIDDLEEWWDQEIATAYHIADPNGLRLCMTANGAINQHNGSAPVTGFLRDADRLISEKAWSDLDTRSGRWTDLLGATNRSIRDYMMAICRISFFISRRMIPERVGDSEYAANNGLQEPALTRQVVEMSPLIFADAVNSVALLWLVSWERWLGLDRKIERDARKNDKLGV